MPEWLTIDEVLKLVPCVTRANLAMMRHDGRGPEFYKPTARTVLYDKRSVMDWVESSAADMDALRARAKAQKAKKAAKKAREAKAKEAAR